MASTKPDEPESDSEPMCIEDRLGSLEACIGKIDSKIDRLLAILDAKENKKLKDRMRIKHKRDEENAAQARAAGKIVVDRLEGTMYTDCRLPYKQWAYIMLEFTDAREFLRWLMHTYLESYYCVRDSRRRMIVRKGNHWKFYAKGCGSEKLATPADMFGGHQLAGHKMLDMVCLRWCHVHVRPIIEHVCNLDRLVFVHQKQMAWNDPRVNDEIGAEPLPLESRWWRKGARFRETMHASLGVYGDGWIRTTKGSMLLVRRSGAQAPRGAARLHRHCARPARRRREQDLARRVGEVVQDPEVRRPGAPGPARRRQGGCAPVLPQVPARVPQD